MLKLLLSIVMIAFVGMAKAEDGSKLWLRAEKNVKAKNVVTFKGKSDATTKIAVKELLDYWHGKRVALHLIPNCGLKTGAYRVASTASKIDVTAASSQGILYAAYHLLRCQQMGVDVTSGYNIPAFDIRILNHWDNLDGSIERGYAGKSIWIWDEITEQKTGGARRASLGKTSYQCSESLRQHITEYARANASIGINGAVLNNVNASPQMLSPIYINKVKAIADILRPYGIKTYLSVNFASPMALGGLKTADPLNPEVAQWWKDKAKEIYEIIPDFGGFLVKANSEGQPGPGDYNRKHSDGANILADALKPYGGIVMWRCFVYGNKHKGEDRVKQAVTEFEPEDGLFRDNVILQAKNGPLDFQPREPYAPVFDQIKKTPLMAELQITQEYLGQSIHLTYLAPMWKEFFSFVSPQSLKGIAGVANIGDDTNWCGHHFSQANWYAFGRLAWNPDLSSEAIAKEWLLQTFDPTILNSALDIMMRSHEACVDYMMPLGLHHIFKADHHYGPEPDGNQPHFPEEWKPVYYHKADSVGIGFNRSSTGTNAVSQYRAPFNTMYDNIETCPEEYLLWFHHADWTHKMKSGRTLWEEMQQHYNHGVAEVEDFVRIWHSLKPNVDEQRYREVDERLQKHLQSACEWRDTCIGYFRKFAEK